MKVWTNHSDMFVATDLADVRAILVESYGEGNDVVEMMNEGFVPVADDAPITINNYDGKDAASTKTAAEWVAIEGRGLLCSTEY